MLDSKGHCAERERKRAVRAWVMDEVAVAVTLGPASPDLWEAEELDVTRLQIELQIAGEMIPGPSLRRRIYGDFNCPTLAGVVDMRGGLSRLARLDGIYSLSNTRRQKA